jgi:probable HAF family extracellular repeat protein
LTDLNSLVPGSGWTLESATAINDSGQIVGMGTNPAGQGDAFLLTPVPEPCTLALLDIGAISLFAYARRRRVTSDGA